MVSVAVKANTIYPADQCFVFSFGCSSLGMSPWGSWSMSGCLGSTSFQTCLPRTNSTVGDKIHLWQLSENSLQSSDIDERLVELAKFLDTY